MQDSTDTCKHQPEKCVSMQNALQNRKQNPVQFNYSIISDNISTPHPPRPHNYALKSAAKCFQASEPAGVNECMSPMTKNTQLICVCYQDLPYILLRHVFLNLSGPITALPGKINKGTMRSPTSNSWQIPLSFRQKKTKQNSINPGHR